VGGGDDTSDASAASLGVAGGVEGMLEGSTLEGLLGGMLEGLLVGLSDDDESGLQSGARSRAIGVGHGLIFTGGAFNMLASADALTEGQTQGAKL